VGRFAKVTEALRHAGRQVRLIEVAEPHGVIFPGCPVKCPLCLSESGSAGVRIVAGGVSVRLHDQAFGEQGCRTVADGRGLGGSGEVPACQALVLTTFGRPGYLRRVMESGARGFVVKDAPVEQLADAIRRVAAGERVVDPALAAATLAHGTSPLSGRERDVLVAARRGASVSDIAGALFLSEGTVRNYLSAAIAKTGTRNRTEAVRAADERGWL
jgi:DNA-binding NarL/FixJ family response regulator